MANPHRAKGAVLKDVEAQPMPASDRGAASAWILCASVRLRAASDEEPFYEETKTRQVNAHGANHPG
jgi:hypothetical protein